MKEVYAFCIHDKEDMEKALTKENLQGIYKIINISRKKDVIVYTEGEKVYVIKFIENKSIIGLFKAFGELIRYLDGRFKDVTPHIIIDNLPYDEEIIYEIIQLSRYKYYSNKRDLIKVKIITREGKEYTNKRIDKLVEYVYKARDIINYPPSLKSPLMIATLIQEELKNENVKIKLIKGDDLLKHNLNLIYSVGKGSENDPVFIILEYKGSHKRSFDVALIGKGVIFDSGGYNIKTKLLNRMKSDVAGGVVCLYAFAALVKRKVKKNIICAVPLVENLISGKSYTPSDVLQSYSGKYVEVVNTDAEGRLILADALSYVQNNYKVETIIDVATLTSMCIVGLGEDIAGIMGNSHEIIENIKTIGKKIGEIVWELPLIDEYFIESIKSDIADIKSISSHPWGGAIVGGMFLKQFIKEGIKWVHIDIAGPSYAEKHKFIYWKGATAFGLRLLVKLIEEGE